MKKTQITLEEFNKILNLIVKMSDGSHYYDLFDVSKKELLQIVEIKTQKKIKGSQELHNDCLAHMHRTSLSNGNYDFGFDF